MLSRQNGLDDVTVHVGQATVNAIMAVREAFVVNPEGSSTPKSLRVAADSCEMSSASSIIKAQ